MALIKFVAYCNGDRTVGDYGQTAEISVHVHDAQHERCVREALQEAFTTIFDERAIVLTEAEIEADDEPEAEVETQATHGCCRSCLRSPVLLSLDGYCINGCKRG